MAASSISNDGRREHGLASGAWPGVLVLAAAIPILFLHVKYQPGVGVGFGSTTVNAYLSDFAVLAVVAAAIVRGVRDGFRPLAEGRILWIAGVLFLVWMFAEVARGHVHASAYDWRAHGTTAAKFAEYALLAPAVPLLLRTRSDLLVPLWALASWSACASIVGIAQFFGADIFIPGAFARRQASFLSSADFAALSGAALMLGIVAFALPRLRLGRALAWVATAAGALGMVVAGAIASLLGLATGLATLAIILVRRRELVVSRAAVLAAVVLVVALGMVAIRGKDLNAFARFVDTSPSAQPTETKVQTYAHRTLLVWIGFEIWKDNPLLGVGWEGSGDPADFERYLPAAHRRFPKEAPLAFPARDPARRYGVQNVWVQALADLGVVGALFWVATFATAAWLAFRKRASATGLLALGWIGLLVWLWSAQSFVAGIPLDALTWLAFGVAATRLRAE